VAVGGVIDGMAVITVDAARLYGPPGLGSLAPPAGQHPDLPFNGSLRLAIEGWCSRRGEVRGCGALTRHVELRDAIVDSTITVFGIADGLVGRRVYLGHDLFDSTITGVILVNGFPGRDLDLTHAVIDGTITVLVIVDALIGGDIGLGISLEIRVNLRLHLGQLALLQGLYLRAESL
jgi:hypothetical protein